jgi:glycerophosphoryl diester phosphodiesterase
MKKCIPTPRARRFTIALTIVLGMTACSYTPMSTMDKLKQTLTQPDTTVMVIAHCGCWRLAPENSIQAIHQCIVMGVDIV